MQTEVPVLAVMKEQREESRLDPARLPLSTRGARIVDRLGYGVRLRCVNWYGAHMHELVVGGLHKQPLAALVRSIHVLGFNCVRLPYSLEMHLRRPDARPPAPAVRANAELQNMSALAIFDATVNALADAHIMIVLNNHQGQAMWCCSEDDGEGLWYSQEYPEEDWVRSLRTLARRYRDVPYVIGFDLRNELRGIPATVAKSLGLSPRGYRFWPQWGPGGSGDWGDAALRAGSAVLKEKPEALIVVEGLDFSTDLRGARQRPLHREAPLRNRVVYEAHDYCWYHVNFFRAWMIYWLSMGWAAQVVWRLFMRRSAKTSPSHDNVPTRSGPACGGALSTKILLTMSAFAFMISCWTVSYSAFRAKLDHRWGFLLDGEAPVWLGEFGTNGYWITDSWSAEVGEVLWLSHILRYMHERDLDYAYWALNGDKAGDDDETFGLLMQDYQTIRHPWLMKLLIAAALARHVASDSTRAATGEKSLLDGKLNYTRLAPWQLQAFPPYQTWGLLLVPGDAQRAYFAQQPRLAGLASQPVPPSPARYHPALARREAPRASSATNLRATALAAPAPAAPSPRSGTRSPPRLCANRTEASLQSLPQAIVATPVAAISGISSAGGMPNPSQRPVVRSYAPPRVVVPAWAWLPSLPSPKPVCRESGPTARPDVALIPTPNRVRSLNPSGQSAPGSACPSFLAGPPIRATLSGGVPVHARAVVWRVKSVSPPPRDSGRQACLQVG
ncbi:unnamed protein product [Symbiodinium natans]|uniref:Glycoside hydrolase family 5 domain-containing protein n=1 Tax=Symbiodinium natans TaxID=878477 RepID=A0A812UGB8_9DINO|nr:unnamed protein product [Symbiodinium natans]